ncbi:aldose 1-epimerase [Haloferula helveola]|uniref:Aldose 1-epimerase n=1 Tax=Haloferula helveola TaxID=490095 RepID=A0ABM7RA76_9BACT|nr:aldose 1-epimerase [Haloferula helveola]
MKTRLRLFLAASVAVFASCDTSTENNPEPQTSLPVENFGTLADGREAKVYTLTNKNGMTARVTDFGATLVSLTAPDKDGKLADITHGFDSVEGYQGDTNPYFGASVGRFGNRIAHGKFTLDGETYELATNNDPGGIPCHLHGGDVGFNKRMWTVTETAPGSITLQYVSADGEEGYPGKLTAKVTYTLTDDNELKWEASATTDKPTVLNLVHHTYWNLSGDPKSSINDHILTLHADRFLPTDAGLIPTGELAPVEGTPMDFTEPAVIGDRVETDYEPLKLGLGYDHCWVLTEPDADGLALAARLKDPKTGRVMEITTNQPAIQFYGGNFLDGKSVGKEGTAYPHRTACCLETENYPDAPNHESFPSAVLRPGETYRHVMVHKFTAE